MIVAVFADAHAHADALVAVLDAAERAGADELWSLGDMIGGGPDPERVVALTRERCHVVLLGNHDYAATGSVELQRLGRPGSAAYRSLELARERLGEDDVAWLRTRRPAARREGVQCWHAGPRNPVWEYVGPRNAADCLGVQRAALGLVGHTHLAAAFRATARGAEAVRIEPGVPLELGDDKWLLNPGAVGAPVPPRRGWFGALDVEAAAGAFWLALDLDARTANWRRAPYDPAPAHARARALGIDDEMPGR
jgi:Calcineurin-like phosphoesterase superfamily domain